MRFVKYELYNLLAWFVLSSSSTANGFHYARAESQATMEYLATRHASQTALEYNIYKVGIGHKYHSLIYLFWEKNIIEWLIDLIYKLKH